MKIKLEIVLTNWVTIIGIFLTTVVFSTVMAMINTGSIIQGVEALSQMVYSSLVAFAFSWAVWLFALVLAVFILDMILMNEQDEFVGRKLFVEWFLIIGALAIYQAWEDPWLPIIFGTSFALTQVIRHRMISRIIHNRK